ncbi:MAG: glycosyltransferase family 4 protein [Lachnospiraceae bacterium]
MKVMILANNDVGLYQFRKELIEELLKQHEVVISLPYGDFVKPLEDIGCKFIDTPVDRRGINPIKDLKLFFAYQKILRQEKPNLVLTYTIKPNVYGGCACRFIKIPYVVNITGLGTAFENGGMLKKIVTVMNKVGCKKAKVVFFENEENRQIFIKEKIVKKSQTYRLNGAGVNLEKYQVAPYPDGEKIKFLFMGRIMAEKGIDELFEAMQHLVSDGINCELDLLGFYEENYKEKIEKYEAEGWLHYYGYQKDVRPFIEASHCFVLPSWHEGMANTNLECAAMGRPVITSNIPGCMEAVIDGKTGYLVERKNANDLYKVMKQFTKLSYDQRKTMGLTGRKHMEEVFDKKKVVEDTIRYL